MSEHVSHPRRGRVPWPRAPLHRMGEFGVFMVTSGTYLKAPMFAKGARLRMLHDALLTIADAHDWRLEAWAVFPNHYHFVGLPPGPDALRPFLQELHSRTAIALNRRDSTPGRTVWHNYRDTLITRQRSYLARLQYVHQNPVRHRVVASARLYPYGSASWFERTATPAQIRTLENLRIDRVNIPDDF